MRHLKFICSGFIIILLHTIQLDAQSQSLKIKNNLDIDRPDEIVEILLEDVVYSLPEGSLSKLGIINKATGNRLQTQLVDSDMDGELDLFLFQDTFAANAENVYELKYFEARENMVHKVYVTFIEGREDIAWENDKVAFRMYGPPLFESVDNGIDVWCKNVDYLIVDKWYREEAGGKSYHKDHGEGADFFSVGKSLGGGGSAIYLNDSLYQSGVYTNYRILANGPLRLMFELEYVNFSAGDKKVTEKKIVTLDAGSYLNKLESAYNIIPDEAKYAAGLVKRANTETDLDFENAIVSLWGDNTSNEEDGLVGTAVIMPDHYDLILLENSMHIIAVSKFDDGNKQLHYAGSSWSKAGVMKSADDWKKYLLDFSAGLNSPLQIEYVYQ